MKPKHKFYVGHPKMIEDRMGWGNVSLKDAVAKAQRQLEQTGEPQIVVKVVRIVYKKPQPTIVEVV